MHQEKNIIFSEQDSDHPAKKNPMLVSLSSANINNIIFDMNTSSDNNSVLSDLLNFNTEDPYSGLHNEIVFQYFHMLEKSTKNTLFIRQYYYETTEIKKGNEHKGIFPSNQ